MVEKETLLSRAQENVQQSNDEQDNSSNDEDYEEYERVSVSPTTLVSGEIVDVFFTGRIDEEDNSYSDFGVRLRNPEIEIGQAVRHESKEVVTSSSEESNAASTDGKDEEFARNAEDGAGVGYKIFGADDPDTEVHDDLGVETPNSGLYKGDFVSEIDEEVIDVYFGGSASNTRIGKIFDANGGAPATVTRDGRFVDGLIEYNPAEDSDVISRVAREPVLRDDLEGERVNVFLARRADVDPDYEASEGIGAYWAELYLDDADTVEDMTELTPVETEIEEDVFRSMEWHENPQFTDDGDGTADTDEYDGLPDEAVDVVEETVGYIQDPSNPATAEELNFVSHVESNLGDADEEVVAKTAQKIEDRLGGEAA